MGVKITSHDARTDSRGASFSIDIPFPSTRECHIATVRPGAVRGNHFHTRRQELLAVLYTDRWTLFWDEGSRTFEGSGAVLVAIDPLSAHAVRNDGSADLQIFVLGDVRDDETHRRELTPPLTRLAGIDGCRAGWVAVVRDGDSLETRIVHSDDELLAMFSQCAIVAIDVPIGLPDKGERACDHHARRWLTRKSSVFTAPIRPILNAATDSEAQAISRSVQGTGLPYTTVALRKVVARVDRLLQRHREVRARIYEVHPEVSFTAWNGEPFASSKKTREGRAARRALVEAHFGAIPPVPRGASEDDLLDAFAALWSAERIARNEHDVLGDGHGDVTGLPMRIVF